MTYAFRKARPDKNHAEIVGELRGAGVYVEDLRDTGGGVSDIVTYFGYKTVFIEIKHGAKAAVKKSQLKFLATWKGHCGIAVDAESAIRLAKEPEKYALDSRQKDLLLVLWSKLEGKAIHLNTVLAAIK